MCLTSSKKRGKKNTITPSPFIRRHSKGASRIPNQKWKKNFNYFVETAKVSFRGASLYVRIIKSGKRFCAFIPRRKLRTADVVLPNRTPSFNFQTSPPGKNQINRAKRPGNPIHSRVYRETSRTVINNYWVKRVK